MITEGNYHQDDSRCHSPERRGYRVLSKSCCAAYLIADFVPRPLATRYHHPVPPDYDWTAVGSEIITQNRGAAYLISYERRVAPLHGSYW